MDGDARMPANLATIEWLTAQEQSALIEAKLTATHEKYDQVKAKFPNDPDVAALGVRINKLHNRLIDAADLLADEFTTPGGTLYTGGRPKTRLAES